MSCTVTRWPVPDAVERFSAGHGRPEQAAFTVRIPTPEQIEMIERQNALLEGATAEEVLTWAVETYLSPLFDGHRAWAGRLCDYFHAR